MYYVGGGLHFLNYGYNIPEQIQKANPNCFISYPIAVKNIVDACPDDFNWSGIKYWEVSGGFCPESVVRSIEKKFNYVAMHNMMASTEADCHSRAEYRPGDPLEKFYGFVHDPAVYNGELKYDEDGVLWYKYGTRDWQTDGDKFEERDGAWFYRGRAFDDVIFMKGGVKIYTGMIEAKALQTPDIENVASCSKDELHYLIYTGTADIHELAESFKEMQPSKRPHEIYQVTDKLFFGQIDDTRTPQKLQKSKLASIVLSGPADHILNHVHVKDHSQV